MAKTLNNPKEKMRMNIELADNGIIIRNPECVDNVQMPISALILHDMADGSIQPT